MLTVLPSWDGRRKGQGKPARSYCQPMMHFIFILQVDLVGNWLLYSISEEMSSNLTRFLNLFDKIFSGLTRNSNPWDIYIYIEANHIWFHIWFMFSSL